MSNEIEELRSQIKFLKWCIWSVGIGLMVVYALLDMKTSVLEMHIRGIYPEPAEEETNIDIDSVQAIPLRIEFKALIFDPDHIEFKALLFDPDSGPPPLRFLIAAASSPSQ